MVGRPSRCTFALAQWLEERHKNVYPKMEGYVSSHETQYYYCSCQSESAVVSHIPYLLDFSYKATMVGGGAPSFLDVRTPVKMPDALRGEKYAFVGLPVAEFLTGGSIDKTNIGVGRLCPVDSDLPADAFVQGVVILTNRAKALASWLAGTEVEALTADLRKRNLIMETDIDTQYLMAKLDDEQRQEAAVFEEGKDAMNGLHFISVQMNEDEDPEGFWLLREIPTNI